MSEEKRREEEKEKEKVKSADREIVKDDHLKPQSNLYQDVEGYDKETNVEVPTDESVKDAKEWVDEENRR